MSTERVNRNFQKFLQSIYHWPTSTIEKSTLIEKLEELCRQNPELEHIYENVPISSRDNSTLNHTTVDHSQLQGTENYDNPLIIPNDIRQSIISNCQISTNGPPTARNESNPSPNMIVIKDGDLTVRKGSKVLSPLIKKNRLKPSMYCELSYTISEGEKFVYLIVYQSRKCRKMVHTFVIDGTCSFVLENKRAFKFNHNSVVEKFTTEKGVADGWISSLNEVNTIRQPTGEIVEDQYENPAELFTTSESSSFETTLQTPVKPAPRPSLPTNPISPEKIYVCLYDHHPSTNNSQELEFNCGDLLYIIDISGPDFYVGHRLILPLNNHNPKGLVFKDYITPAYEKVL